MGNHLLEDGSDITLPKTEPPQDANAGSKGDPILQKDRKMETQAVPANIKSGDSR
jgi:hypothetical protein